MYAVSSLDPERINQFGPKLHLLQQVEDIP
jgi:hypothetical protein